MANIHVVPAEDVSHKTPRLPKESLARYGVQDVNSHSKDPKERALLLRHKLQRIFIPNKEVQGMTLSDEDWKRASDFITKAENECPEMGFAAMQETKLMKVLKMIDAFPPDRYKQAKEAPLPGDEAYVPDQRWLDIRSRLTKLFDILNAEKVQSPTIPSSSILNQPETTSKLSSPSTNIRDDMSVVKVQGNGVEDGKVDTDTKTHSTSSVPPVSQSDVANKDVEMKEAKHSSPSLIDENNVEQVIPLKDDSRVMTASVAATTMDNSAFVTPHMSETH